MARLYLQAGCLLLALLAASALAAAPIKGAVKTKQYQEGEDYNKYDGDNYYYHSHGDDEYTSQREVTTIHLQEVERRFNEADDTNTFKLRCSKPADAADVCLHPASKYGDDEPKSYDSDYKFVEDLLDNDAATCRLGFIEGTECPDEIKNEVFECVPVTFNCTVNKQAEKCGCIYDFLAFTASGWLLGVQASSCEEQYGEGPFKSVAPAQKSRSLKAAQYGYYQDSQNATIYSGGAYVVTAHINHVATNYGYKHVTGKVEFIYNFESGTPPKFSNPFKKPAAADSTKPIAADNTKPVPADTTKPVPADKPAADGATKPGAKAGTAYDHEEYYGERDNSYYTDGSYEYNGPRAGHGYGDPDRHVHLVKGGNLKITLIEEKYY